MKKLSFSLAFVILCFTGGAFAQPRIIEKKLEKTPAVLAPISFKAKYEGGMYGFSKKEEGTLRFDDANFRLVFLGKENKELFAIPYKSINVIYPQSQSVQSTGGRVVQHVPLPGAGIAGLFMKEKKRYLMVNFNDPDIDAKGLINFKLESKELLEKVIQALGDKAEMQQRGEAYYRPQRQKPVDEQ
jgi:hypothetical protein